MSSIETIRVLMLSHTPAVGKTSLIHRLANNHFDDEYIPTTDLQLHSTTLIVDGESVVLQILDIVSRLSETTIECMKFADVFMVVYDTNNLSSLNSCLPLQVAIIQEQAVAAPTMVLVGTKTDLKRRVRRSSGRNLAEQWDCPFWETSAKDDRNITAAFEQLVRDHRARRRSIVHERRFSSLLSSFPTLRYWTSHDSSIKILKSGWINKRGYVVQNWKRRYMLIFGDGWVQYFHGEDDPVPKGEFKLRHVTKITDFSEEGREDGFILETEDRDWYFSCGNSSEKDAWLDVIVRMIAHCSSKSTIDLSTGEPVPSESDVFFDRKLQFSV